MLPRPFLDGLQARRWFHLCHVLLGIKINFVATRSPITAQGRYLFDYGIELDAPAIYLVILL